MTFGQAITMGVWDHYPNFARIHKTLRITPAMAAGLSDHVWSLEEIAMLADAAFRSDETRPLQETRRTGMTDPEAWPLWLKILVFPPIVIGAVSAWLPLAKTPKRRRADWVYYLLLLVCHLFRLEIDNRVRDCGCDRLRAVSLPISKMATLKLDTTHRVSLLFAVNSAKIMVCPSLPEATRKGT